MKIEINTDHLEIIKNILSKHLPQNTHVWVFGSRAKGTAKKYSDLDLAIDMNNACMPLKVLTVLMNDFEESLLPYKVDIIDLNSITSDFHQMIEKESIRLVF